MLLFIPTYVDTRQMLQLRQETYQFLFAEDSRALEHNQQNLGEAAKTNDKKICSSDLEILPSFGAVVLIASKYHDVY